jgi:protein-S-isoprenylcysteine O-methyltransferase Ste14
MGMFWLILSVLVWGIIHSLLASRKAKELFLGWFGETLARFYRLVYNVLSGLSFLPVLVIAAVIPDRKLYSLALPWSALMVFGEFLAVVALVVGFRQTDIWEFFGLRQLTKPSSRGHPDNLPMEIAQGHLVTSGLYRYVRHPLYSAGIVFIWLLPVMTVNALAINIALTIYVVVGTHFEERKLRREFGREYTDYAAVTPMFIPFLNGNKMTR